MAPADRPDGGEASASPAGCMGRPSVWLAVLFALALALGLRDSLACGLVRGNLAAIWLNHRPSILIAGAWPGPILRHLEASVAARARAESPRRLLVLARWASSHDSSGDYDPDAAPGAPPSSNDLLRWGRRQMAAGRYDEAVFLLTWAVSLTPDVGNGWLALGRAQLGAGRPEAAREAVERSVQAHRWEEDGPGEAYLVLASIHQAAGRPTRAQAAYEAALNSGRFANPQGRYEAHYELGMLLMRELKQPAAAIDAFRAARTLRPDEPWTRLRLGEALYWGQSDLAAAVDSIDSALARWPDDETRLWPYFYLGQIYADAGRPEAARAALERALAVDPDDSQVQAALSRLEQP